MISVNAGAHVRRARRPLAGCAVASVTALVLTVGGPTAWLGSPSTAEAAVVCSSARSDLDVNGDGFDDAVVGDPFATVNGKAEAGAVVILYGDADCRIGEGARRLITQATAGVPGTPEAGDHFGWSTAVDDVTSDRRADILVGAPGEDVGTAVDAGAVYAMSFAAGSATSGVTAEVLTQNSLRGVSEAGDQFGYTVAAGDAEGDEDGALGAAGAPGEDLDGVADVGEVDAFRFDGDWRPTAQFHQGPAQSSPFSAPVPGTRQAGDRLGSSLLIAKLNAPFTGDVLAGPQWTYVMGAPGDVVDGQDDAGSVTLAYTQTGALEQVTQNSPGVPGAVEAGDAFGSSLAVHETRGWTDEQTRRLPRNLAVGAPGEDVGHIADAGSVTLFRSEFEGLVPRVALTQDSPGFDGHAEVGDRFGSAVAMRPQSGGSEAVLVIGIPDEDVGSTTDAGMVQTVTVGSSGVHPLRGYTENSAGTPGTVGSGNRFGLALAAMQGRTETLWAVASPYQKAGSVFVNNDSGGVRAWVPGQGGVPRPAGSGRFGWTIGGLESGG